MRLALPLSCFRDLWQHEILRLGAVAFTVRWSNMDYQCEVSYPLPPAFYYLWWLITFSGGAFGARTQHHTLRSLCLRTSHIAVEHTTRNGEAVDDRGYIDPSRNGDAFDTTGYIDPFVRWEGLGGYAWLSVYCQPIHTE